MVEQNGVSTAITTGGPEYSDNLFKFQSILTLRENPSRVESMLFSPRSFTVGPDSCYYVADSGNRRIAVFSQDGEFLRSFGRRGAGPGEFQMMELQWLNEDVLSIFDYSQQRTTYYSTNGTLLEVVTSPRGRLITWMDRLPDDTYVVGGVRGERNESINYMEYRAVVLEPSGRDTIGVIRTGLIANTFILHYEENADRTVMSGHSLPFSGNPFVKYLPNRGILVTDGDRPELAWYNLSAQKAKVVKAELETRWVTADLIQEYETQQRRRFQESAIRSGRPVQQFPDYQYADQIGFCRRLTVDDAGYIWCIDVERLELHKPGEGWLYSVFNPEGRYLGTAELPSSRPTIAGGCLMAFIEDPETGEQVGTVFEIRPANDGFIYP